jgi:hypothetical protein
MTIRKALNWIHRKVQAIPDSDLIQVRPGAVLRLAALAVPALVLGWLWRRVRDRRVWGMSGTSKRPL